MPFELKPISFTKNRTSAVVLRNATFLASLAVTGCSQFPSNGPHRGDVLSNAAALEVVDGGAAASRAGLTYLTLPLTPSLVAHLSTDVAARSFSRALANAPEAVIKVGVGDMVDVSIFEAENGGLFASQSSGSNSGNRIQLPPQQVDSSGVISIPYGGRVRAAGKSPAEIQAAINSSLSKRALEPQSLVTVSDRRSHQVSVLGEVTQPLQFPIDPGGTRLFTAIARAGGTKYPTFESVVVLRRGQQTERALLSDLVADKDADIELQARDVVYVLHQPRFFTAFGASGQSQVLAPINRRFNFDDSHLSLVDALGRAGGLADNQADPRSVFLYRNERRNVLRDMGVNVPNVPGDTVPTIYVADMRDPVGFFLASKVDMHSDDIIFVANAASVEFNKILGSLLPLTTSAAEAAAAGY